MERLTYRGFSHTSLIILIAILEMTSTLPHINREIRHSRRGGPATAVSGIDRIGAAVEETGRVDTTFGAETDGVEMRLSARVKVARLKQMTTENCMICKAVSLIS
jgi:hypothetical protein